jgi:hypothetical protein
MRRLVFVCLQFALLATSLGCEEPPPECIAPEHAIDESCAPGYVPTFTNVYNNTLKTGCGSDKGNCHSANGRAGDLSFATQDIAYEGLLDAAKARVKAGDPACSEMIVRTNSPGEDYQMPPGDALTAPARCALVQWVLQGANP